jgi:hypothetical protein
MNKRLLEGIVTGFYRLSQVKYVKALINYFIDLKNIKKQKKKLGNNEFSFGKLWPCLVDKYTDSGMAKGGYFHQDLLVARKIFENNPECHIDIGSRVDGFVAHVASFRKIYVIDIRATLNSVKNIIFIQQDFMGDLDENMTESCDSVSCLHALEHFGLGRYGDTLNYNGHLIGLDNLYFILKKQGKLYLSVPTGVPQRIEFHAHRIFSIKYLLKQFEGKYRIDNVSFVDDEGNLHEDITLTEEDIENNFGVKGDGISCTIFEMTKL